MKTIGDVIVEELQRLVRRSDTIILQEKLIVEGLSNLSDQVKRCIGLMNDAAMRLEILAKEKTQQETQHVETVQGLSRQMRSAAGNLEAALGVPPSTAETPPAAT